MSDLGVSSQPARRRVLIVEDEVLIGMLLEDMLSDLGYELAATVARIDEASEIARDGQFDVAILDVNLNGEEVYPVAAILEARGIPFVFVTGYGECGLPPAHQNRPTLQKPFQQEMLERELAGLFRK